jgi:hypothetical protein
MKTKDQQLLEEAYTSVNEGDGGMVSVEIPSKLWKAALNAHKLPNSPEVLAMVMGEVVNLYLQNKKAKRQEQKDFHNYMKKVHSGEARED